MKLIVIKKPDGTIEFCDNKDVVLLKTLNGEAVEIGTANITIKPKDE
jgi:hypothetical protein